MFSSNQERLQRAILEAITYFDVFSYPLTTLQVWQNLRTRTTYASVYEALKKSALLKKKLQCVNGMWHLRGGDQCIKERELRYRGSKSKVEKAVRFARLLQWFPGIEAVYVCNSLGFLHAKSESDIDLFIVTRNGRIWSTRFFAVLLAELTGFRPKSDHAKDGLCLSFFAASGAPMETLALPNDVYYLYWMSKLRPVFARAEAQARFWRSNSWVHKELPQAEEIYPPKCVMVLKEQRGSGGWKIGDVIERILRNVQMRIMPPYLKDAANKNTSVVVSDKFLKFHDHDKREQYRKEYEARLATVA
ncbi:hypothetical protein A3B21_04500 [Candidatus Uhrbacteria bacterium RIFCSPLOWO2_01_FULL_47_24]|uniref:Polymerase nucleotidyl transferase domain-containing protein n=1 Tax=Candidatus Uhrbacteria bacterium RIFCSPLOWO2_01_FULL_47_24 TaxID=1802401 RepID=A0A1F7UTQ9_9BACT|nr:MAG: hypothetical protein A2753_03430 [Candidatus Uhrbacteria bacterium RIFCSPHIGHO2_01_FULL_47_11]OGL68943.1 MAG: hypothetical protein A3D58_00360 [Candidatus Uhrbacteria bacterium RIFCSPHIGHO2_02_FULL_46_47]OGL74938.1 MAG: hypothetical protein A3F52_02135 [Candidatus Uhrbacteria bacterium RIFCSPHIGHO2_12_FULL_47_11]OGL81681.1 MAG: hypothetical protein A3B21_04500 [Candidatus Uhrbacteria bacterium RIFCSPLOWO2_01_FULL_47_24]OGL85066.1 MAG: hypothetical protein A3J03_03820 [Candidatus Uhrbact